MSGTLEHTPLALANTFISMYGGQDGIQHMKLQKLAYYAHGWWLAYNGAPFLSERPQVWRYGPVFKSMYAALKHHGASPICDPQRDSPFTDPVIIADLDVLPVVRWVWERYSPYTAVELSDMTHEKGTPWRRIAEERNFLVPNDLVIPDELISDFFQREASELRSKPA
jgi:uncharacterized phage-associated protein